MALGLALVVSAQAFVQQSTKQKNKVASRQQYHVDCSQMKSPACRPFNEMVDKNDREILDYITKKSMTTYVCFRQDTNGFWLLAFTKPHFNLHFGDEHPEFLKTHSPLNLFAFHQYTDGVSDRSFWGTFEWEKDSEKTPDNNATVSVSVSNNPEDKAKVAIDSSEVAASESFTNASDKVTEYRITIRRSTKRFVETFALTDPSYEQWSKTGYCVEF